MNQKKEKSNDDEHYKFKIAISSILITNKLANKQTNKLTNRQTHKNQLFPTI